MVLEGWGLQFMELRDETPLEPERTASEEKLEETVHCLDGMVRFLEWLVYLLKKHLEKKIERRYSYVNLKTRSHLPQRQSDLCLSDLDAQTLLLTLENDIENLV